MTEKKSKKAEAEEKKGNDASAISPNKTNTVLASGIKLRGKTFTGIVVSKDTHNTVRVSWGSKHFVKKYERFMLKKSKVAAHNPDSIGANIGDRVVISECRPLSKTKKFVVIKNLGHSTEYMVKRESIEDDEKNSKKYAKENIDENNTEDDSMKVDEDSSESDISSEDNPNQSDNDQSDNDQSDNESESEENTKEKKE